MLRLHFEPEDLTRVRVATEADPLWELVLSLCWLSGESTGRNVLDLRSARMRVAEDRELGDAVRLLRTLVPPRGYFPDFLTPTQARQGLDAGVEAVLSTSRSRLRHDVGRVAAERALPTWGTDLARGHGSALRLLEWALRAYHRRMLAPAWQRIGSLLDAERSWLTRLQMVGGVEAMFRGLWPRVQWDPPVLSAPYATSHDHIIRLDGRGLVLIPSFFCTGTPVALADPELEPVLVYPADVRSAWFGPLTSPDDETPWPTSSAVRGERCSSPSRRRGRPASSRVTWPCRCPPSASTPVCCGTAASSGPAVRAAPPCTLSRPWDARCS